MKMYLGSINDQVWDVTESDYVILDPDNLTNTNKANKQCNTMALNTIYLLVALLSSRLLGMGHHQQR